MEGPRLRESAAPGGDPSSANLEHNPLYDEFEPSGPPAGLSSWSSWRRLNPPGPDGLPPRKDGDRKWLLLLGLLLLLLLVALAITLGVVLGTRRHGGGEAPAPSLPSNLCGGSPLCSQGQAAKSLFDAATSIVLPRSSMPQCLRLGLAEAYGSTPATYSRSQEKCWSMVEWFCYAGFFNEEDAAAAGQAQNFPYATPAVKPTSALRQRIADYVMYWQHCNQLENPQQVKELLAAGKKTQCKYILWTHMHMGAGSQSLSLLSTFVYAMLTNRILFIQPGSGPTSVTQMFCEPFPDTPSWLLDFISGTSLGGNVSYVTPSPSLNANYSYRTNTPYSLQQPPPVVLQFHVHHRTSMEPLFCPAFHSWANASSAIVTSSNMFWVPGVYFTPDMANQMELLFPSRRVFATLAPLILHPSNDVWHTVTEFLLARAGFVAGSPGNASAAACTLCGSPNPRVGFSFQAGDPYGVPPEEALRSAAQCLEAFHQAPTDVIESFVDSENPAFDDYFNLQMQESGITSDTFHLNRAELRSLDQVLILALASDALVVTPRSTFGYTAVGFSVGAATAFFLTSNDTTCQRAANEPCFLIPPNTVNCTAIAEGEWLQPQPDQTGRGFTSYDLESTPKPVKNSTLEGLPPSDFFTVDGRSLTTAAGVVLTRPCKDALWYREQVTFKPPVGLNLIDLP